MGMRDAGAPGDGKGGQAAQTGTFTKVTKAANARTAGARALVRYRAHSREAAARETGLVREAALVKVLKALADRNRIRMTRAIAAAGELSCGQVKSLFNLSQPTISHHLKILADAGVILVREAGQHRFISANLDVDLVREIAGVTGSLDATAARKRKRT
jgi:ArsR family transcriptional regulator, arsenate/arsenite/antimonite-responsive transcriptional repressor